MDKWKDASVGVMFFASGLSMACRDVGVAVRCLRAHVCIQLACFALAPTLVYTIIAPAIRTIGMSEDVVRGAIFMSCLPTSIGVSLALTRFAGADVAITLVNSGLGNVLGVAVTPLLSLWLIGSSAPIDLGSVVVQLCKVMVIPAGIGLYLRHRFPASLNRWGQRGVFREMQTVALMSLLAHVFSNAFKPSESSPPTTTQPLVEGGGASSGALPTALQLSQLAGLMASLQGLLLASTWFAATVLFRLSPQIAGSCALCGSQKTAAMGVPLLMIMFGHEPPETLTALTLPILCYHPLQAILGGVVASTVLRRWCRLRV